MEVSQTPPLNLYYCYAPEDRKQLQKLDKHLAPLKRRGRIQVWYNTSLRTDAASTEEEDRYIDEAHIILLLVSANFINSEKCYLHEMARALERYRRQEACVIPVLLRAVHLEGTLLSEFRMLPDNDNPISSDYWRNKDEAYKIVAQGIESVIKDITVKDNTISSEPSVGSVQPPPVVPVTSSNVFPHGPSGATLQRLVRRRPGVIHNRGVLISSRSQRGYMGGILCVAWSPDGNWLASALDDGLVRIWSIDDKQETRTLRGHSSYVYSVAWSPDGRLASGSGDCSVRLWESSNEQAIHMLQSHKGTVNSVAWSPDGKQVASCSSDQTICLWDADSGNKLCTLEGHTHNIMSIAWSPDGSRLVSGSRDSTVKLWNASSGRELRVLEGHTGDVMSVAWSPNSGWLASGARDQSVRIWNASNGHEQYKLQGHTRAVTGVAWSPNGSWLASSSHDKTVRLWDVNNGDVVCTLQDHTAIVVGVAWSPDGALLATASSHELYLWRTDTWKQVAVLNDLQGFRAVL